MYKQFDNDEVSSMSYADLLRARLRGRYGLPSESGDSSAAYGIGMAERHKAIYGPFKSSSGSPSAADGEAALAGAIVTILGVVIAISDAAWMYFSSPSDKPQVVAPPPVITPQRVCASFDKIGLRKVCESSSVDIDFRGFNYDLINVNGMRVYTLDTIPAVAYTGVGTSKMTCSVPRGTPVDVVHIMSNVRQPEGQVIVVTGVMPNPPPDCGERFRDKRAMFEKGNWSTEEPLPPLTRIWRGFIKQLHH